MPTLPSSCACHSMRQTQNQLQWHRAVTPPAFTATPLDRQSAPSADKLCGAKRSLDHALQHSNDGDRPSKDRASKKQRKSTHVEAHHTHGGIIILVKQGSAENWQPHHGFSIPHPPFPACVHARTQDSGPHPLSLYRSHGDPSPLASPLGLRDKEPPTNCTIAM